MSLNPGIPLSLLPGRGKTGGYGTGFPPYIVAWNLHIISFGFLVVFNVPKVMNEQQRRGCQDVGAHELLQRPDTYVT
jgi:hypothetical protein